MVYFESNVCYILNQCVFYVGITLIYFDLKLKIFSVYLSYYTHVGLIIYDTMKLQIPVLDTGIPIQSN